MAALIGIFSATGAVAVNAEEGEKGSRLGIEEIVVTATKRESKLQDTPISIYAMTESMLENAGINEIDSLRDVVAGFEVISSQPGNAQVAMRGVSTLSFSPQAGSSVGYYLDEVPLSAINGQSPDFALWDVERVEVLRGPQGTLFGEGSLSGTLRIITNKPDSTEFSGRIAGSLESIQDGGTAWNAQGMINLPLIEDELAVRIVGRSSDS